MGDRMICATCRYSYSDNPQGVMRLFCTFVLPGPRRSPLPVEPEDGCDLWLIDEYQELIDKYQEAKP